jgi:6,7-dimethyl-8-ribityllumazine synthase
VKRIVQGTADGTGLHVGIAVATWNQVITDRLLSGAEQRCDQLAVEDVTILRVPGALELPVAAKQLIDLGCDAVVAIGTVIKGDTDHYEVVVRESSGGVAAIAIATGVPVANAILAVHEYAHALERAGEGPDNKGFEAVEAAVVTATALRELTTP